MLSGSGFSIPSASAGRLSVIRFSHSSCTGSSGLSRQNNMHRNTVKISPRLQESKKCIALRILS